jgi:tetratricopeptide (TPR) repeat protein
MQGCLSSWNLELGREIAEFAKRIPAASVAIPAAQILLDSGAPALARELANRALRLTSLTPQEKLQLEMRVASSYAEEGKRQKTVRQLNQIRHSVQSSQLTARDRADFLTSMGRMQFLLGRYLHAAELFYEASKLFRQLQEWEAAAAPCRSGATAAGGC